MAYEDKFHGAVVWIQFRLGDRDLARCRLFAEGGREGEGLRAVIRCRRERADAVFCFRPENVARNGPADCFRCDFTEIIRTRNFCFDFQREGLSRSQRHFQRCYAQRFHIFLPDRNDCDGGIFQVRKVTGRDPERFRWTKTGQGCRVPRDRIRLLDRAVDAWGHHGDVPNGVFQVDRECCV